MLLATWNVNSLRARFDRLLAFLGRSGPDILCLQETKLTDDEFPHDALWSAGYDSVVHGQKTYNGVAILARRPSGSSRPAPFQDVARGFGDGGDDDQARLIAATIDGVRVVSAYVPNGKTVGSDKWAYKLDWLRRLQAWLGGVAADQPFAIAGDFNVAPEDRDVARPDEWRDSVLCHPDGREALRHAIGPRLTDAIRIHHEGPGPWTWWDYRMLGFPKGNGLRIDHVFLSAPLAARCTAASVDREERKGKLPSDHAPVLVTIDD